MIIASMIREQLAGRACVTCESFVPPGMGRECAVCVEVEVRDALAEVIRQAVQAEREACAAIARQTCDVYNLGNCISRDILARGKGG